MGGGDKGRGEGRDGGRINVVRRSSFVLGDSLRTTTRTFIGTKDF